MRMKSEKEWLMAQKAKAFGMLAAIESESWRFSHPQEFSSLKSKFKHMLAADREGRLVACATSRPAYQPSAG